TEATFPETTGPDLTQNGGFDAFVAKVSADGTGLSYAGFIGGSGDDFGHGVAVDGTGAAYVAGMTSSTEATFPETTGPDLTQNGGTDAFVAKVSDGCTIVGTAAGEKIVGTAGPDVICGLGGGDLIKGLGDDDILLGQDGKDRLIGGAGDDTADGGSGVDTADHRTKGTVGGVTVDLAAGTSVGGASFGSDTLVSIERVIGSLKNDTITGDADANTLDGAKGADMLTGGDGPDILMGGYSADTLDGTDGVGGNDTLRGGAKPNSAIDTCTSDAGDTEVSCEA
ncbi:MAG: SBBP repeat-containing protein, partial [Actinomycetota bacterium]